MRIRCLLVALSLLYGLESLACTSVIVSAGASATGRPLLMKQRDNKGSNGVVYLQGEKYGFVGLTSIRKGTVKYVVGGVNEAGFAVVSLTNKTLVREKENLKKSRSSAFLTRAMGECRTVDEFEELVKTVGREMIVFGNFGVIDASGGAAYFELGDCEYHRDDVPEGGWSVRTNYSLCAPAEKPHKSKRRLDSAMAIMESHDGKFTAEFLVGAFSRSTFNSVLGYDMADGAPGDGYVPYNRDCILNSSTLANICIEGVGKTDRDDSAVMWTTCGWPGAAYSIPVWVAAGDSLPECIRNSSGTCRAFEHARVLRDALNYEGDVNYLNVGLFRRIRKAAESFEAAEFAEGRALDDRMRARFRLKDVEEYYSRADVRFDAFRRETEIFLKY